MDHDNELGNLAPPITETPENDELLKELETLPEGIDDNSAHIFRRNEEEIQDMMLEDGIDPVKHRTFARKDALKRTEIELAGLKDLLTGFNNRNGYEERRKIEIARAQRDGTPLSILFADLRGLGNFNNKFSLDAGDELIKKAAELIRSCLREGDDASRWGGDEFAVMFPNTSLDDAQAPAQRIADLFAQNHTLSFNHNGKQTTLTQPLGIRGALVEMKPANWEASEQLAKEALSEIKIEEKEAPTSSPKGLVNTIKRINAPQQAA